MAATCTKRKPWTSPLFSTRARQQHAASTQWLSIKPPSRLRKPLWAVLSRHTPIPSPTHIHAYTHTHTHPIPNIPRHRPTHKMPPLKADNAPMASANRDTAAESVLTPSSTDRLGAICLGVPTELATPGGEHARGETSTSAGTNTNTASTSNVPESTAASVSADIPGGGARRGAISVESWEELGTTVPRIVQGRGTLYGASGGEAGRAGPVPEEKEKGGDA